MKNQSLFTLALITIAFALGTGCSSLKTASTEGETTAAAATEPSPAANEATALPTKATPMMDSAMMGKMMSDCKATRKSGKKCEHQMMTKCQENMNKDECKKMMKDAKKQAKSKK